MKLIFSGLSLFLITACGGFAPEPLWDHSEPPAPAIENKSEFESGFEEINREILQPSCVRCHNPQKTKGDVDLSSLAAIQRDLKVFKAGRPTESALYLEIQDGSMPPRGEPLSQELTEKVRRWIELAR